MKIPKNMTKEEVIEKINIIVNRIAPKYIFNGYDANDLKQEAFIICFDALDRYDNKRPLENFLAVNLSNRLKNFVRDNFYYKDEDEKKKIRNPSYITSDTFMSNYIDLDTEVSQKEIFDLLDSQIPCGLRADYLKLKSGVKISKSKKHNVIAAIKEILNIKDEQ